MNINYLNQDLRVSTDMHEEPQNYIYLRQTILYRSNNCCNYSELYCPKIMSGVPSKAAFNALTAFMPFFLAVPM